MINNFMYKTKKYAETIPLEEKRKIWALYFYKFYSYDELLKHFKGKYNYSQLKSIIKERYDNGYSGKSSK